MNIINIRKENEQIKNDILDADYTIWPKVQKLAHKLVEDAELLSYLLSWENYISNPSNSLQYKHKFYVDMTSFIDYSSLIPDDLYEYVQNLMLMKNIEHLIEFAVAKVIEQKIDDLMQQYDASWLHPYKLLYEVAYKRNTRPEWAPIYSYDVEYSFVCLQISLISIRNNNKRSITEDNSYKKARIASNNNADDHTSVSHPYIIDSNQITDDETIDDENEKKKKKNLVLSLKKKIHTLKQKIKQKKNIK